MLGSLMTRVARSGRFWLVLLPAGLLAMVSAGPSAAADGTCLFDRVTGNTTCTFASTGAEQTFTVPADVSSLSVVAKGRRQHPRQRRRCTGWRGCRRGAGRCRSRQESRSTSRSAERRPAATPDAPVNCVGGFNGGGLTAAAVAAVAPRISARPPAAIRERSPRVCSWRREVVVAAGGEVWPDSHRRGWWEGGGTRDNRLWWRRGVGGDPGTSTMGSTGGRPPPARMAASASAAVSAAGSAGVAVVVYGGGGGGGEPSANGGGAGGGGGGWRTRDIRPVFSRSENTRDRDHLCELRRTARRADCVSRRRRAGQELG